MATTKIEQAVSLCVRHVEMLASGHVGVINFSIYSTFLLVRRYIHSTVLHVACCYEILIIDPIGMIIVGQLHIVDDSTALLQGFGILFNNTSTGGQEELEVDQDSWKTGLQTELLPPPRKNLWH